MLAKNELWHFFQLAEQGGSMFGPHGVPGGAAPSKLEAAQEQYNVAGGNYFENLFLKNSLTLQIVSPTWCDPNGTLKYHLAQKFGEIFWFIM